MSNYSPLFAGFPQPPSIIPIQANGIGAGIGFAASSTFVPSNGLYLVNKAAADNGNVQYSPPITREGSGLNTTINSSVSVTFKDFVLPINGAGNPTAVWHLQSSIGSSVFSDALTITSTGTGIIYGSSFQVGIPTGSFTSVVLNANASSLNNGINITDAAGTLRGGFNLNSSSGELRILANSGGYFPTFYSNGTEAARINTSSQLLIGLTAGTSGWLAIKAGTTTVAPIILTSGTNLTSPLSGAIEYNGTHFFGTTNTPTRFQLDQQVTAAMSSGQVALVLGTKAVSVTNTTTSSKAFVTLVTASGTSLTTQYQAVCTSGTVTIQANIAAGTINTSDVSTVNYLVIF